MTSSGSVDAFQILTASDHDGRRQGGGGPPRSRVVVVINGRSASGASISLAIVDFRPSLKVVADDAAALAVVAGCRGVADEAETHLRDLRGYAAPVRAYREFVFESGVAMAACRKRLAESGVDAFDAHSNAAMQLMIAAGVSPGEWLSVPDGPPDLATGRTAWYVVPFRDLAALRDPPGAPACAPFATLSFDIECASSHGEFPRAVKGFELPARQLEAWSATALADESRVDRALRAAFGGGGSDDLSSVYCERVPDDAAIARAAAAVVAAARRPADRLRDFDDAPTARKAPAGGDASGARRRRVLAALRGTLGGYRVLGDPVIQIGCCTRRLGEPDGTADDDVVFVLGACEPVPGARVRAFSDERALIRGFFEHVRDSGADLVAGYNTTGFDYRYVVDRAAELGLDLETACDAALFDAGDLATLVPGYAFEVPGTAVRTRGADDSQTYVVHPGRVAYDLMNVVKAGHNLASYRLDAVARHFTGDAKDDITPAQIFASHGGTPADRAVVAAYCVQDCRLVLALAAKLNAVPNALGMAGVCGVPVEWIFQRGQGCKALSLVARQCRADGIAFPRLARSDASVAFEGATVLEPETGAYVDTPVVVLDFASLYPSSIISHNISHDTVVAADHPDAGERVSFELDVRVDGSTARTGTDAPRVEVAFARSDAREGVVPRILRRLLRERKRVKALMKREPDAFARSVLDGLQLAYKVTANSVYGQLGAPTSPIFAPELAAATTAVGRAMLAALRKHIESPACGGRVVYGDTDSSFATFPKAYDASASREERLRASIEAGRACSASFRGLVPAPHDAEYEKTFDPFVLLSKKRYVGLMYTDADAPPERASMGVVLKRRDNAPIVKTVYGGAIDRVLAGDVPAATAFVRDRLTELAHGRADVDDLVISKTLRAPDEYVDPSRIAHVVLARRMNEREAGSAPSVGDRIPYVHVVAPKGTLQGDRIEHRDYLRTQRVDYAHYLTNQLQKPLTQLFCALVDRMPGARVTTASPPAAIEREVHRLLFAEPLAVTRRAGSATITDFFARRAKP